ncbi:MAG: site-2 protease family protein [Patescibacteria group bacterium]|nr:site-2 protease family protein [Patescibacteria group bacterium]
MTIVYFILILVVLILVHEFGHFIAAKAFGIRVDEFGIFFPPRIAAIKKGETEYSINWLPFGGFVKIFGENAGEGLDDPRSFAHKNRWVQATVLVAGIVFNLLFAWLVLSAGYMVGLPTPVDHQGFGTVTDAQATVVDVLPGSPADKAGLLAGDTIETVQTATVVEASNATANDVQQFIAAHADESVVLTVLRDGSEKTFLAKPAEGVVAGRKAVGIELDDVGTLRLPPQLAVLQGAVLGWDITQSTAVGLATFFKQLVTGTANFSQVSGPIGITAFGAAALKAGFAEGAVLTALISVNLALINIIPIPGLDGGRLFITAIEGIIRRPISPKIVNGLTLAGFAFLILLMLVVSYHDIARLTHPS